MVFYVTGAIDVLGKSKTLFTANLLKSLLLTLVGVVVLLVEDFKEEKPSFYYFVKPSTLHPIISYSYFNQVNAYGDSIG